MVKKLNYTEKGIELYYKEEFIVDELIKEGAWLIHIDKNGKKHRSVIQLHNLGEKDDEDKKPLLKKGDKIKITVKC